jgi:hypothetical protein
MSKLKVQKKKFNLENLEDPVLGQIRHLDFDIRLTFACLREAPPCGTKAGILKFDLYKPKIVLLPL